MLVVNKTGQLVALVTDSFQVAVPVSDAGQLVALVVSDAGQLVALVVSGAGQLVALVVNGAASVSNAGQLVILDTC